jgi:hypothetical protein
MCTTRDTGELSPAGLRARRVGGPHVYSIALLQSIQMVPMAGQSVTWLFTRADDSILLQVREVGGIVELRISGPGSTRVDLQFETAAELLGYQADYERTLAAHGYMLERFTRDRRTGAERRGSTRNSDRRTQR